MLDRIIDNSVRLVINFRDGSTLNVGRQYTTRETFIKTAKVKETACQLTNNPVGVLDPSILTLEIKSLDGKLIPDNEDSPYFGLMDETAFIDVWGYNEDGEDGFRRYYVETWGNTSNINREFDVDIVAKDVLGILFKNEIPKTSIVKNKNTNNLLTETIDKINEGIGNDYKIRYIGNQINIEYNSLEYNLIEAVGMNNWLNVLSQSTLTNIFIDRSNNLRTLRCVGGAIGYNVCLISDQLNVLEASIDKGSLVGYTGVIANYVDKSITGQVELANLSNVVIKNGVNKLENISLGERAYKILGVVINSTSDKNVQLYEIEYGLKEATLNIISDEPEDINVDIKIIGQQIMESMEPYKKTFRDSNQMLEVTNRLLTRTNMEDFTEKMLQLLKTRSKTIKVRGYFNFHINIGDTVELDLMSSKGIMGLYRVIGAEWDLITASKSILILEEVV